MMAVIITLGCDRIHIIPFMNSDPEAQKERFYNYIYNYKNVICN